MHTCREEKRTKAKGGEAYLAAWFADVLIPLDLHECVGEEGGDEQGACMISGSSRHMWVCG